MRWKGSRQDNDEGKHRTSLERYFLGDSFDICSELLWGHLKIFMSVRGRFSIHFACRTVKNLPLEILHISKARRVTGKLYEIRSTEYIRCRRRLKVLLIREMYKIGIDNERRDEKNCLIYRLCCWAEL